MYKFCLRLREEYQNLFQFWKLCSSIIGTCDFVLEIRIIHSYLISTTMDVFWLRNKLIRLAFSQSCIRNSKNLNLCVFSIKKGFEKNLCINTYFHPTCQNTAKECGHLLPTICILRISRTRLDFLDWVLLSHYSLCTRTFLLLFTRERCAANYHLILITA